jgi:hypothetical protein
MKQMQTRTAAELKAKVAEEYDNADEVVAGKP